jgi:hypothetical protein
LDVLRRHLSVHARGTTVTDNRVALGFEVPEPDLRRCGTSDGWWGAYRADVFGQLDPFSVSSSDVGVRRRSREIECGFAGKNINQGMRTRVKSRVVV